MLPRRFERLPRHQLAGHLTVVVASTWRARLLGLALVEDVPADHALLLPRCRSVHTFGMRFAIDIVFLNRAGDVVQRVSGAPRRRTFAAAEARAVLETCAGQAERFIASGAGASPRPRGA